MLRKNPPGPVLEPYEINRLSPQANGLKAWFTFRNGVSRNIFNSAAIATVFGTFGLRSSERGQQLDFNGSTVYARLPGDWITNPFSFSAWLWLDTFSGSVDGVSVWLSCAGSFGFHCGFNGTSGAMQIYNNGWKTGTGIMPLASWHQIGCSYSGGRLRMLFDGAIVYDAALTLYSGGSYTYLGLRADASIFFDGMMDDVRFYNRGLSAAEIWHLYDPATRWQLYAPIRRWWALSAASGLRWPVVGRGMIDGKPGGGIIGGRP
jgi:hypothetical protein